MRKGSMTQMKEPSERYKSDCIAHKRALALGLIVLIMGTFFGGFLFGKNYEASTIQAQNHLRTIVFQVHYSFAYSAYSIKQSVYLDDAQDPLFFVFPERDASGWSPAGNGGYYEWHLTIPASTRHIKVISAVVFLPTEEDLQQALTDGHLELPWGTTFPTETIDLQSVTTEGAAYLVIFILVY